MERTEERKKSKLILYLTVSVLLYVYSNIVNDKPKAHFGSDSMAHIYIHANVQAGGRHIHAHTSRALN